MLSGLGVMVDGFNGHRHGFVVSCAVVTTLSNADCRCPSTTAISFLTPWIGYVGRLTILNAVSWLFQVCRSSLKAWWWNKAKFCRSPKFDVG